MNRSFGCLLLMLYCVAPLLAQDTPNYRLSFRMTESATGQEPSSKNYVLLVQSKARAKVNASLRLPHYSSSKGDANELHTVALGNIIECIPEERQSAVRLDCAFESSFVAPSQPQKPIPVGFLPQVYSRQSSTTALVPLGKEIQLISLDDPATGNRIEIYVRAEQVPGT